jgi:hypothetical protein
MTPYTFSVHRAEARNTLFCMQLPYRNPHTETQQRAENSGREEIYIERDLYTISFMKFYRWVPRVRRKFDRLRCSTKVIHITHSQMLHFWPWKKIDISFVCRYLAAEENPSPRQYLNIYGQQYGDALKWSCVSLSHGLNGLYPDVFLSEYWSLKTLCVVASAHILSVLLSGILRLLLCTFL